jgi:hypothetical protein
VRNAVEHSDEKLLGIRRSKKNPPFDSGDPYSLRLGNKSMAIGRFDLTYQELVSAMTKMYRTVEKTGGAPTGPPCPSFPNAVLRTQVPARQVPVGVTSLGPSKYIREIGRLSLSH